MKIAILSRNEKLYSTKRLVEASIQRGHDVKVIDYLRCYMNITSKKPTVQYGGEVLETFDAIIPRIGANRTFYGTAILRQFETMNVTCLNSSIGISRSRDKLRSLQLLAMKGVNMPRTGFAHHVDDTDYLIKTVGGAPLVIKLIEGTQGLGVVLAETKKAAESVIQAFRGINSNIIVQEFIAESKGADIRCFVVGGKVVAAIKRQSAGDDFRSNIHRGGSATLVKISKEERAAALTAAKVLGLKGIETATKMDVASKIIKNLEMEVAANKKRRYEG